jgi:hypothetical protein
VGRGRIARTPHVEPMPGQAQQHFRYTTEELHSITTQSAASDEMTKLCSAPSSRKATPSSCKEAPSDIDVQDTKGGKKRCKQCPQWVIATADYDGGNNEKVGNFGMGCITTAARRSKHQARSYTNHIEKLLDEASPNHV